MTSRVTSPGAPAGFLTREERRRLEGLRSPYNKFWVPCAWFGALAGQARREGRVRDDCALKLLMEVTPPPNPKTPPGDPQHPPSPLLCPPPRQELNRFRAKCSLLFHYDWISVPLVYTQVGAGGDGGGVEGDGGHTGTPQDTGGHGDGGHGDGGTWMGMEGLGGGHRWGWEDTRGHQVTWGWRDTGGTRGDTVGLGVTQGWGDMDRVGGTWRGHGGTWTGM